MTNAWPDKAQFQSLDAKVNGLQSNAVPRLRESGPDLRQQIANSPQTLTYTTLTVRPVSLTVNPREERTVSELRVQVPDGTTALPSTLTVSQGGVAVPLVGEMTYVEANGARWLSLPVRVALTYATQALSINGSVDVVTGPTSEQNTDLDTSLQSGRVPGVWLVMTGPRTIAGRLSADAFPVASDPTPNLPDGAVELVLNADPPYLRTVSGGTEYHLPFVAVDSGGGAT